MNDPTEWYVRDTSGGIRRGAILGHGSAVAIIAVIAAAMTLLGATCKDQQAVCRATAGFIQDPVERQKALDVCNGGVPAQATPTAALPTATATEAPREQPSATATSTEAPTVAATVAPSPTAQPAFTTRLRYISGFHGCNPYPCDPTKPECAAIKGADGKPLYPIRTSCSGDRTAFFEMVGYDVVPKGAGCAERYTDQTLLKKCLNNDSPATPCNGAPACDGDHMACQRVSVSCNGLGWDAATPSKGSQLYALGPSCSDGKSNPGFAISCNGTPGTPFTICAIPWPNARTDDGRPIVGGAQFCKNGYF